MGFLTKLVSNPSKGRALMPWGGSTSLSAAEIEKLVIAVVQATPVATAAIGKRSARLRVATGGLGGAILVQMQDVGKDQSTWRALVTSTPLADGSGCILSVALEQWKELDRSIILGSTMFTRFRDDLSAAIIKKDSAFTPV